MLNARGHRSGTDAGLAPLPLRVLLVGCSTPEGIEAAPTGEELQFSAPIAGCSTPEGIEAAPTAVFL